MGAAKTKLSIKLPQAQDDTGSVLEGGMLTLDVLDNDKGGNSTSIYSIDQGDLSSETSDDEWIDLLGGGRIKIVDDEIIFDTAGDFEGLAEGETTEVVFNYAMRLGNGAISQAEVRVEITGQNDAPTVTDVTGAAMEDGAPVEITLDGDDIDSDDDGTTLTYQVVSGPAAGSVMGIVGNKLTFDPGADFQNLAAGQTQDVTITYKAIDAHGAESGTATVTVTVTGVNDDAVVTGDSGEVFEDGVLTAGGTVGITDVDDGEAEIQAQTNVAGTYGMFSIDTAGVWSYQLNNDEAIVQDLNTGDMPIDSFTVWSKDGFASATVDVTVNGENDSTNTDPVAVGDVIIATVSTDAVIPVEWLLANDSDLDLDTLTVTAVSVDGALPAGWVLDDTNLGIDGTFSVTTPGALGTTLNLEYTVSDGNGGSTTGTATIELASPSTTGDDNLDISGRTYDFSFIEGKDGGDTVHGGDSADTIFGGNTDGTDTGFVSNVLIGDVSNIGGGAVGDPVIVGSYTGANDTIFGGNGVNNSLYGDNFGAVTLAAGQNFLGGNDLLTGGDGAANTLLNNTLIGDLQAVFSDGTGSFTGGNDVLTGGDGVNFLSIPGVFLLYYQSNMMVGDVSSIGDAVTIVVGGNDTLISGALAADTMTGDFVSGPMGMATGGMDTFVFGVSNGTDTITDFEVGVDTVQLDGLGFSGFGDLAGMWTGAGGFGDLTLDLDGAVDGFGDVITFSGYAMGSEGLLAGDFVFT